MKQMRNFLCMMLTVLLLVSCDTAEPEESGTSAETVLPEMAQVLNHVYREEELRLPAGLQAYNTITPRFAGEDRMLTVCYERVQDGEETVWKNYLCESGTDGGDPVLTELPMNGENARILHGSLTDTGLVCVFSVTDPVSGAVRYTLGICDTAEGSFTELPDAWELEAADTVLVTGVTADRDGYICLATDNCIAVFQPDSARMFDKSFTYVSGIGLDSEGRILVNGYLDSTPGRDIKRVLPETKTLEAVYSFPADRDTDHVYLGPGYDVYYGDNEGLYGIRDGVTEMVMHWENSGVQFRNIQNLQVFSADMFLIRYVMVTQLRNVGSLFVRAEDIDLSEILTVELACVGAEPDLEEVAAQFNRKHPGMMVVVRDYSVYNSAENPTGGETRLMNDILNGLYTPDIVSGTTSDRILSTLIAQDMVTDLYSLMEPGDRVQAEDIVGCVKNTFEIDGKLTALGRSFILTTLLARQDTVGYRTYWTVEDLLDLAFSVEDGQYLMEQLTVEDALERLLGGSTWDRFIDMEAGTCDFHGETFRQLLELLEMVEDMGMYRSGVNRYEGTQSGKVLLQRYNYSNMGDVECDTVPFAGDEMVRIGYPTSLGEGAGTLVTQSPLTQAYVILSDAAHPAEAWDFLDSYIGTKYTVLGFGISPLKSLIREYAAEEEGNTSFFGFDGNSSSWGVGIEKDITYGEDGTVRLNGQPGILTQYSREKMDDFIAWLEVVGTPFGNTVPAEVSAIIEEEISAFLGGSRSASATAGVIQSRVSLWLSEHS